MKALWRRYDIDSAGTLDKEEVHHSRETAFCCFWCHFHTTNDQREAFSCSDQSGEVDYEEKRRAEWRGVVVTAIRFYQWRAWSLRPERRSINV